MTLLVSIIAESKPHGHVSITYSASKDRLRIDRCVGHKLFPGDVYERWQENGDLRTSDQESKQDGMPSTTTEVSEAYVILDTQLTLSGECEHYCRCPIGGDGRWNQREPASSCHVNSHATGSSQ